MHPVILFDGECNFCDSSVQFIIKNEPQGVFHFASLQSDTGKELLQKFNVPKDINSMILIENDKVYDKSAAALRISRHLKGAWKFLYALIIVPRPLRNALYNFIAKNRYKWFGKKESCMLPSPSVRARFI